MRAESPEPSSQASQRELFSEQPADPAPAEATRTSGVDSSSEKRAVHGIIAEFRRLLAPLQAIANIQAGVPDSLDKLEAALARLPAGDLLGQAVEDLRSRAQETLTRARHQRIADFKRYQAEFIERARQANEDVREAADGWRVGMFEVLGRPEKASGQLRYDREVVVDWFSVADANAFSQAIRRAQESARKLALPESVLMESFWEAYTECRARLERTRRANPNLVPLRDLYPELRLTLVRRDLRQKPDKKINFVEFPRWAFLYNLDLYRRISSGLPAGKRLTLQTGSQQETEKFGVVINGLNALQDYQKVCYILEA